MMFCDTKNAKNVKTKMRKMFKLSFLAVTFFFGTDDEKFTSLNSFQGSAIFGFWKFKGNYFGIRGISSPPPTPPPPPPANAVSKPACSLRVFGALDTVLLFFLI